MFKELLQFHEAELKIDQMINDVENEIQTKINEATSLRGQYQKMLVEDVTDGKKRKSSEYTDQQAKVDKAVKEVAELEDRLCLLKDAKTNKLTEMIPSLHEGYEKAVGQATDDVKSEIDKLKEYREEYMRQVKRVYEKRRKASEIHDNFKSAARAVTDQFERQFLHLPEINLYNNHAGDDKVVGILEHEVNRVIGTGQLPAWMERSEK
jgi:dsDNA-specific endonuclease/ATPase MutS2